MIKSFVIKGAPALALLLASAAPALPSTLFTFSSSTGTNGSITDISNDFVVTTTYNTIVVGGGSNQSINVTEKYDSNSGLLTFTESSTAVAGTFSNITSDTLFSVQEAKNLVTNLVQSSPLSLYSAATVTSITVNPTFLTDLGVPTTASIAAITDTIQTTGSTGTLFSTVASFTTVATPEPSSFALLGLGLLSGVFIVRRKLTSRTTAGAL
jgi:hypothetical protein